MSFKNLLISFCLSFLLVSVALAEVPKMINYQGKLTTPEGALIDTTIPMTFAIYTDSISTDSLWSETQSSVVIEKGIFSVLLGSVNPIPDSVFTGEVRYLGVKAGDDSEMTPRKAIVSVGYSFDSDKVDGFDVSPDPEPNNLLTLDSTGKFPQISIPPPIINVLQDTVDFTVYNPDTGRVKVDTLEGGIYQQGFWVFAIGDIYGGGQVEICLYINDVQKEKLNPTGVGPHYSTRVQWTLLHYIGKEDPDWNPEHPVIIKLRLWASLNVQPGIRCTNMIIWGF